VARIQRRLAMKKIKIRVLRLKKDIPLPSRATPDSVGFDLTLPKPQSSNPAVLE
jgi:dUTPase